MDWYLDPYDWDHTTDRHECRSVGIGERPERHDSDREAEPDLEQLKLSMSSIISAWGIYIVMIAGLFLYSAVYSPNVYDIGALDLSDAIQRDSAADVSTRESSVFQP
jgi:hypothetical protein